ncbi:hypothetical protein J6590_071412 [Homalodisca vitripennis]|nr:hypothetical protein J6590_071412 [Homalodisca vitripennis]
MFLGGTYRRLETEVHKAKYGNRLSRSTPHHFSSVFAYGASRRSIEADRSAMQYVNLQSMIKQETASHGEKGESSKGMP